MFSKIVLILIFIFSSVMAKEYKPYCAGGFIQGQKLSIKGKSEITPFIQTKKNICPKEINKKSFESIENNFCKYEPKDDKHKEHEKHYIDEKQCNEHNDVEIKECGECDGKISNLTLKYKGDKASFIDQAHIAYSMLGLGSNGRPTSFVLHKSGLKRNDAFLDDALCTQDQKCRDEYPYNSTLEGGETNYYAGYVSVRYVSKSESSRQGNFIKQFYGRSPVETNDAFLVIPLGGQSGFFDKRGMWNPFPKGQR